MASHSQTAHRTIWRRIYNKFLKTQLNIHTYYSSIVISCHYKLARIYFEVNLIHGITKFIFTKFAEQYRIPSIASLDVSYKVDCQRNYQKKIMKTTTKTTKNTSKPSNTSLFCRKNHLFKQQRQRIT